MIFTHGCFWHHHHCYLFKVPATRTEFWLEKIGKNVERDRQLTYTAHGPHKADLRIRADGAPVEDTLSRGQLKLLMCALRLAQGEFLTRESGRRCLYLIDDFASELDDERREK